MTTQIESLHCASTNASCHPTSSWGFLHLPVFPEALWCLIVKWLHSDFMAMEVSGASKCLAWSSLSLCSTVKSFSTKHQTRVNHLPLKVSLGRFYRAQLEENEQRIILNLWIFTLSTVISCSSQAFNILLLKPWLQNLAAIWVAVLHK